MGDLKPGDAVLVRGSVVLSGSTDRVNVRLDEVGYAYASESVPLAAIQQLIAAAEALYHDILSNDGWCYCGANVLRGDPHMNHCKFEATGDALAALPQALRETT